MIANKLIHEHLNQECPNIHSSRLQAIMDVACALQKSRNLALTSIGRKINGSANTKHKIKKVDRLESNQHLHGELNYVYTGLSSYVFKYLSQEQGTPIIIDLCYVQDNYDIQMLSAEVASKGRTLPIYREVFSIGELKGRAKQFLENLSRCIPSGKKILIIMDAGFGEDWLKEIELYGWYWLIRIRQGKDIKINNKWLKVKAFMDSVEVKAKNYNNAAIMVKHNHPCRIVTKRNYTVSVRKKPSKLPRNYNSANGNYSRTAKEPWILATNLPLEYNTVSIVNYYKKRMQIEESFRDTKSHRYGLSARYARTQCIYRWGVKMLLAAITQIVLWVIGIIGHSKNFQKKFQANTVKDKKVFSYFFLGQLIVEHNMVEELAIDYENIESIINQELARKW